MSSHHVEMIVVYYTYEKSAAPATCEKDISDMKMDI